MPVFSAALDTIKAALALPSENAGDVNLVKPHPSLSWSNFDSQWNGGIFQETSGFSRPPLRAMPVSFVTEPGLLESRRRGYTRARAVSSFMTDQEQLQSATDADAEQDPSQAGNPAVKGKKKPAWPLLPFDAGMANNVYNGSKGFEASNANDMDPPYWTTDGKQEAEQIIYWKGKLDNRRKIDGLKINWAYAPGEVKIQTSPDGINFEDTTCWGPPPSDDEQFTQEIDFPDPRNVLGVKILMKKPKEWKYMGINNVSMIANPHEPIAIANLRPPGNPPREQCLITADVDGERKVTMGPCKDVGDGRGFFRMTENELIQHIDDAQCLTVGTTTPREGDEVILGDCGSGDVHGGSQWEYENSQIRLSKFTKFCLNNSDGKRLIIQTCSDPDEAGEAQDKWFPAPTGQFPPPSPPDPNDAMLKQWKRKLWASIQM